MRRINGRSLLALAAVFLFHAVNNAIWLSTNMVTIGWDRLDHLVRTLSYNNILSQVTPATLFKALTWSDYYPPLVHVVVVAAYKLFGVATDVAAMTNLLYLAVLLGSVYAIGKRIGDEDTGILAALLVSLFPMVFAFSRYLYLDFALTAMVAANLALLLATDRFRQRRFSWLYGLSFGLGMLTKWTFAAFVAAPLLWIVCRRRIWREALRAARALPAQRRAIGVAVIAGTALSAAWLLPNADRVQELVLGWALVPLFAVLFAATLLLLTRPDDVGWNALAAGATGVTVAGTWYFTKINFIQTALVVAYGKPTGRAWGFRRYLRYLWTEELSPIFILLFVIAVMILIGYAATHRHRLRRAWVERDEAAMVLLWLVVPYVIFSWRASTIHARYILPLVPAVGLVVAAGLTAIAFRRWRQTVIVAICALALLQFAALTFDGLQPLRDAAFTTLPGGRLINWFAGDWQNQLPASGLTDPGYWIVPDVLERVEAWRVDQGLGRAELAIIINDAQVHEKHFLYQIYVGYPHVFLRELARNWSGRPAYPQLFEADFVLLEDRPHPRDVATESKQTIQRVLYEPADLFRQAFALQHRYTLPDGENVYLYRRVLDRPHVEVRYYQEMLQDLSALWQEDDVLLIGHREDLLLYGQLGAAGFAPTPLPTDVDLAYIFVDDLYSRQRRLILVQRDNAAATTEAWLNRIAYRAYDRWYGNVQLIVYATGPVHLGGPAPVAARFGSAIHLTGYSLDRADVRPGGTLRLTLTWRTDRQIAQRLKVFVHVLGSEGQLIAQRDSEPLAGTLPTTAWPLDREIHDRLAVILPDDLAAGLLTLRVGLYDPETGQRLPVHTALGVTADSLALTTLVVK